MLQRIYRTLTLKSYNNHEVTKIEDHIQIAEIGNTDFDNFKNLDVDWDSFYVDSLAMYTDDLKFNDRLGFMLGRKDNFEKSYAKMCEMMLYYYSGDCLTAMVVKSYYDKNEFYSYDNIEKIRNEAGKILKEKGVQIF